ncbi:MAG: hypothetical protein IPH77_14020 [Ignavibacteria bacterium]|nr:hypothetical protein [Ignavibacteria bacterium]
MNLLFCNPSMTVQVKSLYRTELIVVPWIGNIPPAAVKAMTVVFGFLSEYFSS